VLGFESVLIRKLWRSGLEPKSTFSDRLCVLPLIDPVPRTARFTVCVCVVARTG